MLERRYTADSKEPVKRRALLMLVPVVTLMACEICDNDALIQAEILSWCPGSLLSQVLTL